MQAMRVWMVLISFLPLLAACVTARDDADRADPALVLQGRMPQEVLAEFPIGETDWHQVINTLSAPQERNELPDGGEEWVYPVTTPGEEFEVGEYVIRFDQDGTGLDIRWTGSGPCAGLAASEVQSGRAEC